MYVNWEMVFMDYFFSDVSVFVLSNMKKIIAAIIPDSIPRGTPLCSTSKTMQITVISDKINIISIPLKGF
jgi:hypothetical protein